MVSYPQTQNQERLPLLEQVKNIRSYLFRSATEQNQSYTALENRIAKMQAEIDELKRR